ncbi:peroxiredoxin-like family protein [Thermus sediminis]|uniref:peroxiredoxin-like family protein n=1 Tax=Thermus sediminis TaxID=1761908 RepID=UPI000E3D2F7A|nr:peroxiredoxin-like family protein [Thermus sediminis]
MPTLTTPPWTTGATPRDLLGFLARHGHTGRLTLVFAPGLGLSLDLAQGRLVALGGPLAPRIALALEALGLSPQRIAAWRRVLATGLRPAALPEGPRVQRLRFVVALSPLLDREAAFRFQGKGLPAEGPPVEALLEEAEGEAHPPGPPLDPLARFRVPQDLGEAGPRLLALEAQDLRLLGLLAGGAPLALAASQGLYPWRAFVLRLRVLEALGLVEVAHDPGPALLPGDPAPQFTLVALDGRRFSLGERRGGKTLLAFFRHGGCPFCNRRVQELKAAYPRLKALGVEVVGVFGSPRATLLGRVGRQNPPFPILADPEDRVHALYRTRNSLLGLLDPRAIPYYLEGLRLGIPHGSTDGELLRMPAEFLIGEDLRIARAHYGRNGADRLPLEAVVAWAQGGDVP